MGAGLSAIISGRAIQELRGRKRESEGGRWRSGKESGKENVAKHDVYALKVEQRDGGQRLNRSCSRRRGEGVKTMEEVEQTPSFSVFSQQPPVENY